MKHRGASWRSLLLAVPALALTASAAQAQSAEWTRGTGLIYPSNAPPSIRLDQDTMLAYNGYASGWADCWQSFTAGQSGSLARLQVWASLGGATTLTLYAGEGTGGTLLFSSTSLVDIGGGRYEVPVTGVTMTAGAKYTIRLTTPSGVNWIVGTYSYPGGTSNVYGTGADFAFKTFYAEDKLVVTDQGRLGLGTGTPTAQLDITGNTLRLRTPRSPAANSACVQGELSWDSGYIYVCVANNTWRRSALVPY